MQRTHACVETTRPAREAGTWGLPEDFRRVAFGEAPLNEAFLTLAHYQEEQARNAADLLERETWAASLLLTLSTPIWPYLPHPTLLFSLDQSSEPAPYHLQLGNFAHLTALVTPSKEEEALIAAPAPCWARVYPLHERQLAGQSGALACSYVPISTAEAVALLGLGRILAQIETATHTAGQSLLMQAEVQRERRERLLQVEQLLGWEAPPVAAGALPVRMRLVSALLGQDGRARPALRAALLALLIVPLFLLLGGAFALLALMVAGSSLLLWKVVPEDVWDDSA